jgi:hypothetical protein
MRLCAGEVIPVTDAIGLGEMQGPSSVKEIPHGVAGAKDLVKLRTRVEATNLRDAHAPHLLRHRLGHPPMLRN